MGGTIAFPQADATWRGVLSLRKMAFAVWGMTQHRDPGGCSFSSLLRSTSSRLSSSIYSTLCPGSLGNWLQTKFCTFSASSAIYPWQTETLIIFTAKCYLSFFPALAGEPAWGLDPTLLRGSPSAAEISLQNFSCCLWEPSQPSRASSSLPTSLAVVKWFLLCPWLQGFSPASVQLVILDDFCPI